MEIEIKLGPLDRETAARVFSDPEIAHCRSEIREIPMHTVYYDTADRRLRKEHITLRLRQEGDRPVCTLKTGAVGPDGVARRLELEHEAETIGQGVKMLLADPRLPEELRPLLEQGGFVPTCGARFLRRAADVRKLELEYELSGDFGVLYAGERQQELGEIELELITGNPEDLQKEAQWILEKYQLTVCPDSKQKRAAALEEQP